MTENTTPSTARRDGGWSLDVFAVTAWVAALATGATVGAQLAYANYYSALGVSVGEVDLSPMRLLSVSGVVVLAVAGVVVLGAVAGSVIRWLLQLAGHDGGFGGFAATGLVALYALVLTSHVASMWLVEGLALLGVLAVAAAPHPLPPKTPRPFRVARRSAALAAALVIVALWGAALAGGAGLARQDLRTGWTKRDPGVAAGLILPEAKHVCVRTGGGTPAPPAGVLLGSTDGIVLVVDAHRVLWRLPADQVVMTAQLPRGGCPPGTPP